MSKTETLVRDARDAADEAAKDPGAAAHKALNLMRQRAQDMADRAQALRGRAQDFADRAQALRTKAQDFASQAPDRARGEIDRRRSVTASRLETLAEAIRPDAEIRANRARRTAVVAGGSAVALAAAVGLGVTLGILLSRELKKRAAERAATDPGASEPAPPVSAPVGETAPLSGASGLPH